MPRLVLHIRKCSLSNTIAVWGEIDHTQKGSLWRRLNGSTFVAKRFCLWGVGTIVMSALGTKWKRTPDDKESGLSLSLLLFALVSLKRASVVSLQLVEEKDAYFQHLLIPLPVGRLTRSRQLYLTWIWAWAGLLKWRPLLMEGSDPSLLTDVKSIGVQWSYNHLICIAGEDKLYDW